MTWLVKLLAACSIALAIGVGWAGAETCTQTMCYPGRSGGTWVLLAAAATTAGLARLQAASP